MKYIESPSINDVLCGRVCGSLNHFGNETFRRLVTENKYLYTKSKKLEKIEISRSIVRTISKMKPPGMFVKYDDSKNVWVDIGFKSAVSKTSQALRESRCCVRKIIPSQESSITEFISKNIDLLSESQLSETMPHITPLSKSLVPVESFCEDNEFGSSDVIDANGKLAELLIGDLPLSKKEKQSIDKSEDILKNICLENNGTSRKLNPLLDDEINYLIYETFVLKDFNEEEEEEDHNSVNSIEVFDKKLKAPVNSFDNFIQRQSLAIDSISLNRHNVKKIQKKDYFGKAA